MIKKNRNYMKQNDLKPDLGFIYLKKYGKNPSHYFYEVEIRDIMHVDNGLYSFTSYPTIEGNDYAATFDFPLDILKDLLNQIKDNDFKSYLTSTLVKEYVGPEKAAFYETPIYIDLEATLGEPVASKYETFVPFIVKKFSNLII